MFFKIISGGKTGLGKSPILYLMQVVDRQRVVVVLEGALYFRAHSSYLSGAYLYKSKTAENEFKSDAQKVHLDTFQTLTHCFCVTLVHHFVTVWTSVNSDENTVYQWFTLLFVTTEVAFQKVVFSHFWRYEKPKNPVFIEVVGNILCANMLG